MKSLISRTWLFDTIFDLVSHVKLSFNILQIFQEIYSKVQFGVEIIYFPVCFSLLGYRIIRQIYFVVFFSYCRNILLSWKDIFLKNRLSATCSVCIIQLSVIVSQPWPCNWTKYHETMAKILVSPGVELLYVAHLISI